TGDIAEDLAAEMLATTLGVPFNSEADYDEKQEIFRMNGKIIETKNITSYATVKEENEWATVIALAVFIL
ncbi:MAG: pyruvoyl-dependent arginine decarboxylase, partial [Candidatus Lokiarchaeota archaeon]|nr:pyruvoyl-dependent arginine decarboxylase [Candidatus Lokiarchaeota archaeon]